MSLKLQNHLFKTYKQSQRIQVVCTKSCNAPCAQRSMCSINSPLSQLLVIWLYSFLNKNLRKQISQKIAALKEKKKAQTNVVTAIVCDGKYWFCLVNLSFLYT